VQVAMGPLLPLSGLGMIATEIATSDVPIIGGSLGKIAAKGVTQGHHALPKFLGGDAKQVLSNIDSGVHSELHSVLRQNLKDAGIPLNVGGRGGSAADWARYMNANPGAQRTAFDAVLDASRAVDARNGTSITQDVWRNIMSDRFTPFP
jgi:hypothetical protein